MRLRKSYLLLCQSDGLSLFPISAFKPNNSLQISTDVFEKLSNIDVDEEVYFSQLQQDSTKSGALRNRGLNPFFTDVYCVVPDRWTKRATTSVRLIPSKKVEDLAGLAIASETHHLAPEQVCYHYERASEDALSVTSCSLSIVKHVQTLTNRAYSIKGIITHRNCQKLLEHKSFGRQVFWGKALSKRLMQRSLLTHSQREASLDKRNQRWLWLLLLLVIGQVCMVTFHQHNLAMVAKQQQALQVRQQASFSTSPAISPSYTVVSKIIKSLPPVARFNEVMNDSNHSYLSITASSTVTEMLLETWRKRWPEFQFHLHGGGAVNGVSFSNSMAKLVVNSNTRSVQNVVIEVLLSKT